MLQLDKPVDRTSSGKHGQGDKPTTEHARLHMTTSQQTTPSALSNSSWHEACAHNKASIPSTTGTGHTSHVVEPYMHHAPANQQQPQHAPKAHLNLQTLLTDLAGIAIHSRQSDMLRDYAFRDNQEHVCMCEKPEMSRLIVDTGVCWSNTKLCTLTALPTHLLQGLLHKHADTVNT